MLLMMPLTNVEKAIIYQNKSSLYVRVLIVSQNGFCIIEIMIIQEY